ncbi:MAG: restriction endonuclease subunit R [Acidobacteria bacterium]|nr:restriction endonuclease subunit R [Acidobacteriota bacterium]
MRLEDNQVQEHIRLFIEKLKSDRRLAALDEAATKQGMVLPLLSKLGWDTFNIDEVVPEYSVGDKRVDYALRIQNANKVFIEVKKPSEDLERHQEQLLNYSFQEGVKLAALTNGTSWWFYLPLHEGSWEQRKFYTVDVAEQDATHATDRFIKFLSRENVETGNAIGNAESLYKSQQKVKILRNTLPEAWNKLVSEADELLIDLLSETTEKLCGYKADAEVVERFLVENKGRLLIGAPPPTQVSSASAPRSKRAPSVSAKGYTGKSIGEFELNGRKHRVGSWIALLLALCDVLVANRKADFEKVLSLEGRKRPYFSRTPDVLRLPKKIKNTDIFVETNLSANSIARICFDMISLFGYPSSSLILHTE